MLPANSAAAGRITRREKLQPNLTAFTSYSEPSPAPRAHFKSATDGVAAASAALTVCRPAARIEIAQNEDCRAVGRRGDWRRTLFTSQHQRSGLRPSKPVGNEQLHLHFLQKGNKRVTFRMRRPVPLATIYRYENNE